MVGAGRRRRGARRRPVLPARRAQRVLDDAAALLSGAAAAAGIALINSIGNLGGFGGPYLVGLVKDATGSTDGGLIVLAVILAFGAVVATRVTHVRATEEPPEHRTGRFDRTQVAEEQTGDSTRRPRRRPHRALARRPPEGGVDRAALVWRPGDLPDGFRPRAVVVDGETDADLLDTARAVDALDGTVVTASPGGWLHITCWPPARTPASCSWWWVPTPC